MLRGHDRSEAEGMTPEKAVEKVLAEKLTPTDAYPARRQE